MTNAELFAFLFAYPTAEAEEILTRWILQSRRFQLFLVEYRTKVRKKLRSARSSESLQSLLLELDIARHLVEDPRCRVEYEKYGQSSKRSPDLTVTFRTRTCFNLEATRVQMAYGDVEGRVEKLIRIVCEKLGQSVPQMLNCLVIATEGGCLTEDEVIAAMKLLKRRVDQRDGNLLAHVEFNDPSDFYKQFQWLNGIVLCSPTTQGHRPKTVVWTNSQSRYPLPPNIQVILQAMTL
ncbi:MAG: hypothetical protein JWL77_2501 [Chthonomonadaceae bacterium]|nr:hypothetical protein [Chthonomonadaceae bacterium]